MTRWFIRTNDQSVVAATGEVSLNSEGYLVQESGSSIRFGDGTTMEGPRTQIGTWTELTLDSCPVCWYRQLERQADSEDEGTNAEGLQRRSQAPALNTRQWVKGRLLSENDRRWRILPIDVADAVHFNANKSEYEVSLTEQTNTCIVQEQRPAIRGMFPNSRFRCGFELETQRVHGATFHEDIRLGFQQNKYDKYIEGEIQQQLTRPAPLNVVIAAFPQAASAPPSFVTSCAVTYGVCLLSMPQQSRDEAYSTMAARVNEQATRLKSEGRFDETKECYEWCKEKLNPFNIGVHSDGSVSGPEIVTNGPQTVEQFKTAVNNLFDTLTDLQVDAGCSFHIHLSVSNWNLHHWHRDFQALMLNFLVDKIHMWPDEVVHRCAWNWGTGGSSYFRPDYGNDKYYAVAPRNRRTWEFRLWGGIKDRVSAMRCLHLSIAAYNWARKMFSEGRVDSYTIRTKQQIILAACEEATRRKLVWDSRNFSRWQDDQVPSNITRVLREIRRQA